MPRVAYLSGQASGLGSPCLAQDAPTRHVVDFDIRIQGRLEGTLTKEAESSLGLEPLNNHNRQPSRPSTRSERIVGWYHLMGWLVAYFVSEQCSNYSFDIASAQEPESQGYLICA